MLSTAAPDARPDTPAEMTFAARYTAAREVSQQPTALSMIRKLIREMRATGAGDDNHSSQALCWADELDWLVTHMEADNHDARDALVAAGWLNATTGEVLT